ncbi:uncharacterized protein MONOS_4950 [Monocercomonoides exilis]|uniref:uncharacterized protein n=1 Tax=Monocercomonoides exilis TaxID=2049356 RepID=UPI00355A7781|nr:hypothetical protein MONOS_4950 [Monocercomonoides exilis]|eukprot:MONOS_4950.1-p1 / transcript=MONOS_4950.1 / gene=MONOS_4950 / organism=Monocercomonoides_exilis_PA203 / gene_product=unspecified product / transcript_product=unspecified product / location=Mono_scaffold00138:97087-97604(-) / protein_length=156 / sequence_SO=supercontig / SO=protein_coding / is_pseudo=false
MLFHRSAVRCYCAGQTWNEKKVHTRPCLLNFEGEEKVLNIVHEKYQQHYGITTQELSEIIYSEMQRQNLKSLRMSLHFGLNPVIKHFDKQLVPPSPAYVSGFISKHNLKVLSPSNITPAKMNAAFMSNIRAWGIGVFKVLFQYLVILKNITINIK